MHMFLRLLLSFGVLRLIVSTRGHAFIVLTELDYIILTNFISPKSDAPG